MKLFRAHGQQTVNIDDVIANGHIDWDARVNRAIASETAWRTLALSCLLVSAISIGGNVYQSATKPGPVVVHIVHDSIGNVITVASNSPEQEGPSEVQLKAAIEGWVANCRSIFVDINAMRRTLTSCAALIQKASQADVAMARFYNSDPDGTPRKEEPFYRAQTETVSLKNVVAVPPTASDIGPQHMQTWSVSWMETVTGRDGSYEVTKPWAANVTFILTPPKDMTEAQRDPDGIHIVSWTWTEK
jgi:type IV secretory pathway TrbF-like protein